MKDTTRTILVVGAIGLLGLGIYLSRKELTASAAEPAPYLPTEPPYEEGVDGSGIISFGLTVTNVPQGMTHWSAYVANQVPATISRFAQVYNIPIGTYATMTLDKNQPDVNVLYIWIKGRVTIVNPWGETDEVILVWPSLNIQNGMKYEYNWGGSFTGAHHVGP